jgi:sodium-dependent dicarboxylate transporter 2/3/5
MSYVSELGKTKLFIWVLVIVVLICFLVTPAPAGLSVQGWWSLGVFLVTVILWATEPIPLAVTAMLAIVLQIVLGVATVPVALSGFASSAVFLIVSGFLLAAGLMKSGLDERIAHSTLRVSRNPNIVLLLVIIVTAGLSMLISNTATVLLLLPVILIIVRKSGLDKKVLLLGLVYAANVGGVGLLIGSSPNVIAAEALGWGFFEWMIVGLPFALVMLPLLYISLVIFFRPHKNISRAAISKIEKPGPMKREEKICISVIVLTLGLWVTTPFHGISSVAIGLIGGFLMFLLLYNWNFFQKNTNWGVIILVGGAISLGNALSSTGAAAWIADGFLSVTGLTNPALIVFFFAIFAIAVTQFIQNTATAGMLTPILVGLAATLNVAPAQLLVIPIIATSMTFLMPPGTAPNAIVHGAGIKTVDMIKAGILPTIMAIIVIYFFSMA